MHNLNHTVLTILLTILIGTLFTGCTVGNDIEVSGAWGRPSPQVADNGAFYMELTNQTDSFDALVGVKTDACLMVELHDMKMADGVMKMEPVDGQRIPLPPSELVQLAPGGLHVMCMGKQTDFAEGAEIDLTLNFERAESVNITAVIGEQ